MKLVLKGDFSMLSNFDVIKGIYTVLPTALNTLEDKEEKRNKKELIFTSSIYALVGHKIKIVKNIKTEIITVIID